MGAALQPVGTPAAALHAGSLVTVASDLPNAKSELHQAQKCFVNISFKLVEEDITDRSALDALLEGVSGDAPDKGEVDQPGWCGEWVALRSRANANRAAFDQPGREPVNQIEVEPFQPDVPGIDRIEPAHIIAGVEPALLVTDGAPEGIAGLGSDILVRTLRQRRVYADKLERLRAQGLPTLPSTIAQERAINPFMRCDAPDVITAAQTRGAADHSGPAVLGALREWKNSFR